LHWQVGKYVGAEAGALLFSTSKQLALPEL
jgi:hypothetical protein